MTLRNEENLAILNKLIEKVNAKLTEYNSMIKPIKITEIELHKHQRFFQACESDKQKKEETVIIKSLEEKLSALRESSGKNIERLNSEIEDLFSHIEKLDTKLFGESNRTSPSFLIPRK